MTQPTTSPDQFEFEEALRRVIARVDTWSYADSDAGVSPAEEIAGELSRLATILPTASLRPTLRQAQDALDDGLPAETVAAALYRLLAAVQRARAQASGPPSPSE
jgi:hypothetical protein